MDWAKIDLKGAGSVPRVCAVYEVYDTRRVPDGKYRIKVVQYPSSEYRAFPNICVRSSGGIPEWTCGSGRTEAEALEAALAALSADLEKLHGSVEREAFEWSDPVEF